MFFPNTSLTRLGRRHYINYNTGVYGYIALSRGGDMQYIAPNAVRAIYFIQFTGVMVNNAHCKQGENNTNPPSSFSTQFDVLKQHNQTLTAPQQKIAHRETQHNW